MILYLRKPILGGVSRVKEWIFTEVENRASTEDSLVAREAPVYGGVNGSPLRKVES